jgi:hypothetical protein
MMLEIWLVHRHINSLGQFVVSMAESWITAVLTVTVDRISHAYSSSFLLAFTTGFHTSQQKRCFVAQSHMTFPTQLQHAQTF